MREAPSSGAGDSGTSWAGEGPESPQALLLLLVLLLALLMLLALLLALALLAPPLPLPLPLPPSSSSCCPSAPPPSTLQLLPPQHHRHCCRCRRQRLPRLQSLPPPPLLLPPHAGSAAPLTQWPLCAPQGGRQAGVAIRRLVARQAKAPVALQRAHAQGIKQMHHELLRVLKAPHAKAPGWAQQVQTVRQTPRREGACRAALLEGLKEQRIQKAVEAGVGGSGLTRGAAGRRGAGQVQQTGRRCARRKTRNGSHWSAGDVHKARVAWVGQAAASLVLQQLLLMPLPVSSNGPPDPRGCQWSWVGTH